MGIREKNQEKILRMLRCHGSLSVGTVMRSLRLSEASVRRYFADLERSGQVFRYHGGIRLIVDKGNPGYRFDEAFSSFAAEKHLIGAAAAKLICSHDRLFFDSGTTVLECGNALAERLGNAECSDLRIVTNSLAFGAELTAFCPVGLTGGTMRLSRMDLCGSVTLENLRRCNFTKSFLGTDAISPEGILSSSDEETAELAATVLEHSDEAFILADSSKLGKKSFVSYGTLQAKKVTLITNTPEDMTIIENLRGAGAGIVLVHSPQKDISQQERS
ncbi:MAG: DeoR/GlpR transcriptional regulator [Lentisphaeria bacterium]|nr:DeoR/GlpR transcriptional regulator [Lentisphaeria bacterium]